MDFDTAINLSIPLLFVFFLVLERLIGGGRDFPAIRFWTLFGIAGFLVSGVLSVVVPTLVAPAMVRLHLLDLSGWGLWGAVPVVILTTFLTYWSHRLQHRYDLLWRLGHQFHHSVMRVDIASGMIFHPVDLLVQFTMATLAATLLGVDGHAAGLGGAMGFVIALYQHFNVRTPAWIGYLVQSPECHLRHHQRDVHARNFGDLPLWDMLFGTYASPADGDVDVGFEPERSRRWLAMLACVDVNKTEGRLKL